MPSRLDEIRSLVCKRCWTDVFDTSEYERLCATLSWGKDVHAMQTNYSVSYTVHISSLRISAEAGCTWCNFVLSTGIKIDAHGQDHSNIARNVAIRLRPYSGLVRGFEIRFSYGYSVERSFHAFTTADDEAAAYVRSRLPQADVSPEATKLQIQNWIHGCEGHENCSVSEHVPLPSRVIEISPTPSPQHPRLLATYGLMGKYAAFSYCWGKENSGVLTNTNMAKYEQRLPLEDLPKTYLYAISVAKAIPMDYLWIDALCILQDSEADKTHEIARMRDIYRNSHVTVVAASSKCCTEGFLQTRASVSACWVPFRISKGSFGTLCHEASVMRLHPTSAIMAFSNNEPVNSRAWTLQEIYLSPRVLFYGSNTLQWRCAQGPEMAGQVSKDQFTCGMLGELTTQPSEDKHFALMQWRKLIAEYSKRKMALATDKLPALAGIAEVFSSTLGPRYYAGLWEYQFVPQLQWYISPGSGRRIPSQYRAPSWSWVSLDGPIRSDLISRLMKPCCTIVDLECTPKSVQAMYSEVVKGHLVVRGNVRHGRVDYKYDKPFLYVNVAWKEGNSSSAEATTFSGNPAPVYMDDPGPNPALVTFLPLTNNIQEDRCSGLLLTNSGSNGTTYKRVGLFILADWSKFANEPLSDVTII